MTKDLIVLLAAICPSTWESVFSLMVPLVKENFKQWETIMYRGGDLILLLKSINICYYRSSTDYLFSHCIDFTTCLMVTVAQRLSITGTVKETSATLGLPHLS